MFDLLKGFGIVGFMFYMVDVTFIPGLLSGIARLIVSLF